jgi:hypothetical protein
MWLVLSRKHIHKRADIHKIHIEQVLSPKREEPSNNELSVCRTLCLVTASDIYHEAVINVEITLSSPIIANAEFE